MHTLPQEIEVWYIIPAIRREMAMCFSREHKIS
ncbi:transcriptional regulator, partial [Candidatus Pacearchaeota archaeon CG_4_9_14_0_2_um_filter_39_13]